MKKPPSEVAQKNSNSFFSLTASTAQIAQTAKFMFQNMAYRPTVYRTGENTVPKEIVQSQIDKTEVDLYLAAFRYLRPLCASSYFDARRSIRRVLQLRLRRRHRRH